ncbi:hypothetical protein [Actinoplanes xinjiangensis]|uniref:hypothetical protein n=1 Tax=Actinoplanes xinjiangensis TaxID=512350 RepID=UPI003414D397
MAGVMPDGLGLIDLASVIHLYGVQEPGLDALGIMRREVVMAGRPARGLYAHDARTLLSTTLTADELADLWCAATAGVHRLPRDGIAGREWMESVRRMLSEYGDPAAVDEFFRRPVAPPVVDRVRQLIERFTTHPDHEFPESCPGGVPETRRLLRDLAGHGHPDLVFRMFLHLASTYYMPIPEPLHRELLWTVRALGRDDDVIDVISGMVEDGPGPE